jgi:tetratricopeptide (TPR) repeat protein
MDVDPPVGTTSDHELHGDANDNDRVRGEQWRESTLQQQMLTIKQEVDALQIQMAKVRAPWYRDVNVLVAIGALILTAFTAYVSIRHTRLQDIENAKGDLRELIREISTISAQAAEIGAQYEDNPQGGLLAGSLLNSDKIVLANQAADIIDEIPDHVSAAEYYSVGFAVASIGNFERAIELYARGIEIADDRWSAVATRSGLALSHFAAGDLEAGRRAFEGAIHSGDDFTDANSAARQWESAFAHFKWSEAELTANQCAEAQSHYEQSRREYAAIEGSFDLTLINPQLNALNGLLTQRC